MLKTISLLFGLSICIGLSCCKSTKNDLSTKDKPFLIESKLDSLMVQNLTLQSWESLKKAKQIFAFQLDPYKDETNQLTSYLERIPIVGDPIKIDPNQQDQLKQVLLDPSNYILNGASKLCMPTPIFGLQFIHQSDTINMLLDTRCNEVEFFVNDRYFNEDIKSDNNHIASYFNNFFHRLKQ